MTATKIIIATPRGVVIRKGKTKSILLWNPAFRLKWQGRFDKSQVFVDRQVYEKSEPYTPFLSGSLIKTGRLGTIFGQGFVHWLARYASPQYYALRAPGSRTGALRGPFWFERMKLVFGHWIIGTAKRIAGTGK